MNDFDLSRYHKAQEYSYQAAFAEIKEGYKRSHWMCSSMGNVIKGHLIFQKYPDKTTSLRIEQSCA